MDFITALPTSNGKDALWVIIDRLTKMGHFVASQGTMDPEDLADHFLRQVIRPHGLPSSIVSDRGSLFTSDFWKRVTEALGISCNLSTAFHPQTDGQTERANATLDVTLGLFRNRSVQRIKGNQATFDNSQRNNLRSCVWVRW